MNQPPPPLLGITVLPEFIQSESVSGVLDRLKRIGVTAVATSPYVMERATEETGHREPPADAGAGNVRLLDRPLWGQHELWVRTAPSFRPTKAWYQGLRYQPPEPSDLTEREGPVITEFIQAAHERGLQVFLQVQAAIPPGYRVQFGGPTDDDIPLLPDGTAPSRRVANNASLASPHLLDYQKALIRDLCHQYPDLDGIRFDWPEYPPYLLDSAFLDFSVHAQTAAKLLGFHFGAMRRDAAALYARLHGRLTNRDLESWLEADGGRTTLLQAMIDFSGVAEMLRFKATLSERLLAEFRRTMNEVGGERMQLCPSAFPPPWSLVSGMDFRRAARHCDAVSVKLYGMHWAMILQFYGRQLAEANPQLDERLLVRALVRLLDIADDEGLVSLEDYHYPLPDERHPVGEQAQKRKIAQAQRAAGRMPIHVLAHGYGPLDDFRHRIQTALAAGPHGVWINRYGYLSDQKLDAVGEAWSGWQG